MISADNGVVEVCADKAGLNDVAAASIPQQPCLLHLAFNSLRTLRFLRADAKVLGLDVTSNRLVSLADASSSNAPHLQWLDVADNFIGTAALRSCPAMAPLLYGISFSGNSLELFEPPPGLQFLHWLDVSKNPFRSVVCLTGSTNRSG